MYINVPMNKKTGGEGIACTTPHTNFLVFFGIYLGEVGFTGFGSRISGRSRLKIEV